ncbi:hypothetical protein PVAG01_00511 [Phlyctema vagabunda]|uniref:Uncharacterized protein n=1 Tax=Phlyctema vagabunda TaxID=108571 RepID=A0ABR4PUG5_9HELO
MAKRWLDLDTSTMKSAIPISGPMAVFVVICLTITLVLGVNLCLKHRKKKVNDDSEELQRLDDVERRVDDALRHPEDEDGPEFLHVIVEDEDTDSKKSDIADVKAQKTVEIV